MFERNSMQPQRRVVSDVRPAHSKKPLPERPLPREPELQKPLRSRIRKPVFKIPRINSSYRVIAGALGTIGLIAAIISYIYWSATLTVVLVPKKSTFTISNAIPMVLDAKEFSLASTKQGEGVSAESKAFSTRASGTLVVYNNYSSDPQTLVERTRFQTKDGLIYRSKTRITVPGKQGLLPGSIEVGVEADAPGEKYNLEKAEFTIPGFSGTPKFKGFYGSTKTAITGGASGQGKVVGNTEARVLLDSLASSTMAELHGSFPSSITNDYISFPSMYSFAITERVTDPPIGSPAEKFFGEVQGSAKTLAIAKQTYTEALAKALFKDQYHEGSYMLADSSSLSFSNIRFDYEKQKITFSIEGQAVFQAIIPIEELKKQILSASNAHALDNILASFDGIARAEETFQPALFRRVPRDINHLVIEVRP